MRMILLNLAMTSLVFLMSSPLHAGPRVKRTPRADTFRELLVPQDYSSIQTAINSSVYGDTVLVSPGTYYEQITMKEGVNIVAEGTDEERASFVTAERTIIDGSGGTGFVITVRGADDATLDGFTVTGALDGGLGVLCVEPYTRQPSSPRIQHCIIRNNSIGIGGAFGASPLIRYNRIHDNEVGVGTRGSTTSPLITENEFYYNTRVGIGCDGSSPTIDGNYIGRNGGAGIGTRNGATPLIINNMIGVKDGEHHGNALAGIGCDGSSPTIRNNTIMFNADAGVGVKNYASPIITDNDIGNNFDAGIGTLETEPGSQIEVHRNWIHDNARAGIACNGVGGSITNNVVVNNGEAGIVVWDTPLEGIYNNVVAYNDGVGIGNNVGTAFPIQNNISISNTSPGIKDDSLGYDYNLVYDNNATYGETGSDPWVVYPNYGGNWAGEHDILPISDPMFVDPENGDFHLQSGSPAIDTGNPDPAFNDADASRNDMGAYGGPNPFTLF